jgi:glycine/D-amino acid oxidase-like deaminating enzyme/nitrite reductase/ring-hydroxylating ferredoxin subunit
MDYWEPDLETNSLWQRLPPPAFRPLGSNEVVDVCVVGAGISGLSVALSLLGRGKTVAVLERNHLSRSQTLLSSAHVSSVLDERYLKLRRLHGQEGIFLAAESHRLAVDKIEKTILSERISCGFERVPGFLVPVPGENPELLGQELHACHEAGLTETELLPDVPSLLFSGPCLRFPSQASLDPALYLYGLAAAVERRGGRIFTQTEALAVEGGEPARVKTSHGYKVSCEALVVATNVPFNDRFTMHTKMAPYRTYVIGLSLPPGRLESALLWDTGHPCHYVRAARDLDGTPILLVGGEDHRTGQCAGIGNPFQQLRAWAAERLGVKGGLRCQWSGQVIQSNDGLAYIGRNPNDYDNVYIVTGDSGNGLTHGTIAGLLLGDLLEGKENPWAGLYEPSRINLRSLGTFAREIARTTTPYVGWISPGDVDSVEKIPTGEGAVIREGAQKIAVYKDHHARLHFFAAACPHLSGIVRWNALEKTWDCPCHGSRFDRMGQVLNGPAPCGLRAIADTGVQDRREASA